MDERVRLERAQDADIGIQFPVKGVPIKPKNGYCINCDNKHGCKSRTPPCIDEMTSRSVSALSGKQYLIERRMTGLCRDCPFLRSCWNMEEYKKMAG